MSATAIPHPNETARELIGRDYLSYSAVSLYRQCPLKFFFRYVRGLPEETVAASLAFGGAIHAAAEFHFRELMAGNEPPDLDTLLAVYQDEWRQRASDTIRFGKGETVNSLGRLADRMLRAFQACDLSQPAGRIIGVEEELRGRFAAGCPDVLARIDLLTETDEALVVTDLKTSRSRWSREQLEDAGEQLLLYHSLVAELIPDKPVQLQFAVVTKTKTPAADLLPVDVTPQRLERTKHVVQRVWRSIEAEVFYPAPSPLSCPACPFREACRQWPDA
jgi:putative RecB family exonuclease